MSPQGWVYGVSGHAVRQWCCVSNMCQQHATKRADSQRASIFHPPNLLSKSQPGPAVSPHWPDIANSTATCQEDISAPSATAAETSARAAASQRLKFTTSTRHHASSQSQRNRQQQVTAARPAFCHQTQGPPEKKKLQRRNPIAKRAPTWLKRLSARLSRLSQLNAMAATPSVNVLSAAGCSKVSGSNTRA